MKKKIIIVMIVIFIALGIVGIYSTLASNSTIGVNTENTYDVILTDDSTIEIPAKSSKIIYYQITNTNKGRVKYGIGYKSDNIVVKEYWDSTDPASDVIDYGENKFIKLKLINNTTSDDTVILNTIMGYENGGDIIVPDDQILVTEEIEEFNMLMAGNDAAASTDYFLRSSITKEEIASITFVGDNIVPTGLIGVDVSLNEDGTVMMWYTENAEDNTLYDVYIGSENGTISISSGRRLFSNLTNANEINFSNRIDTSQVIRMEEMFLNCSNITTLDVSGFDTSNVIYMWSMFNGCSNLADLDVSNLDTSKVTAMNAMFSQCDALVSLDLSNFDTSNVTDMSWMFWGSEKLSLLDVSSFDTSNVTTMYAMFGSMTIVTIDISNFDTSNVTNMSYMFAYNYLMKTVYVSEFWNTISVSTSADMFPNCDNLIGGSGTTYNASYIDKTYARIDGGTSSPGYFTYKASSSSPATVNMVDYITNLYTSYSNKFTVSNNSIDYYYADIYDKDTDDNTSGGLMNDRLGGTEELSSGVGNIRYYGANPNNYVYFNCDTYPSANCEFWRIIGVFDGKIKIIRNESIGTLSWDTDYNDDQLSTSYSNDWYNSSLQQFLNGLYYDRGTTTSHIYYSTQGSFQTTLQLQNIGIKSNTRNIIQETTWNLGGSNASTYVDITYGYERGDMKCSACTYETLWTGKIALMYPSDYGYATDFTKCVDKKLNSYSSDTDSYACRTNDWIYRSNYSYWFLSPVGNMTTSVIYMTTSGAANARVATASSTDAVPVVYLKSNLMMEEGHAGTESDPYRISIY